jgi:hypothetical protein
MSFSPRLRLTRKNVVGAVKAEADRCAASVLPIIRGGPEGGRASSQGDCRCAEHLRHRDGSGRQWNAQSVANILDRA